MTPDGERTLRFSGGLLGHWAVWTKTVVDQFKKIKAIIADGRDIPSSLLTLAAQITDANAAFFDVEHDFHGVIAGIHEVLRRQGLLQGIWTLNADEKLSDAQKSEIDRVYLAYPFLNDDDFIAQNLSTWLS